MSKKHYILMFLVGFLLVLAPSIYADRNVLSGRTDNDNVGMGGNNLFGVHLVVATNETIYIKTVGKFTASTSTEVRVQDYAHNTLATGTYVGGIATLNQTTTLTAGNVYFIVNYNNAGTARMDNTLNPVATPLNLSYVKIFGSAYWNGAVWSNYTGGYAEIRNFTISDGGVPTPEASITVTLNTPINLYNTSYPYINFSANITYGGLNISNCSLYTNLTGSWQINRTNTTTIANNSFYWFNNTYIPTEGTKIWNIGCSATNGSIYFGTNRTFNVDTTPPNLTTAFLNNSVFYRNNITGTFNLSDENLIHSYNLSINGYTILSNDSYNIQNVSLSLNYNISNLSIGKHNLTIRFADGHTDEKLKDPKAYNPDKCLLGDCLVYQFTAPYKYGQVKIKQKDGSIFDNWDTEEKTDRYIFKFKPNNKKASYTFIVETSSKYDIVNNNKYGNWIIYDKHWLDFMPYQSTITRISDTIAEVTINADIGQEELTFNSIGDLNIVEINYTFYKLDYYCKNVTNGSQIFCPEGISINSINYNNVTYSSALENFNISLTYPNGSIFSNGYLIYNVTENLASSTSSGLTLNLTEDIIIPTYNADRYIPFYFKAIFNDIEIYTLNYTQQVLYINVLSVNSSCAPGLSPVFNFKFYDEANLSNLTIDELDYIISYGYGGNSSAFLIYGKLTTPSNASICINSSFPYYTIGEAELKYKIAGYSDRSYYIFSNTRATSTPVDVPLYSLTTGLATSFQITAQSTSLNPYTEKYVQLLRWYPELNSYKVVEMGKTDDTGSVVVRVKTEDVDYRIGLYYKNGSLIELANPIRMVCLSSPCTYTLNVGSTSSDYTSFLGIQYTLTYDTVAELWTFTFNDPEQKTSSMNLTVYKDTSTTNIQACSSKTTGSVGVLTCSTTGYTGNLRAEVYREASPPQLLVQKIITIGTTAFASTFGLWLSLLLAIPIVFVLVMISPIGAIVGGVVALLPALYLGSVSIGIVAGIGIMGGIVAHFLKRIS